MNQNQNTKKALRGSLTALFLCIVMLIGTTFAWFTDSVSSGTNKIQAGNLDVTLEELDTETGTYVDVSGKSVFSGNLWEPGYTDAAAFKVGNDGSLALKYELDVITETADANKLAEAIDVYYFDGGNTAITSLPKSFNELKTGWTKVGTLDQILANGTGAAKGNLEAGQADYAGIALHMREEAGNEYENLTAEFDIVLKATQDTVESDSFDNQYDKDANVDFTPVTTVDELTEVLNTGKSISLTKDLAPTSALNVTNAVINGNGNSLTGGKLGSNARVINLTTGNNGDASLSLNGVNMVGETSQYNSKGISAYDADTINLNVKNSSIEAKAYAIRIGTGVTNGANVNVENSTLIGWAGLDTHSKTNGTFKKVTFKGTNGALSGSSNSYNVVTLQEGSQNSILNFENCTFDLTKSGTADYYFFGANLGQGNIKITCKDCTFIYNGKTVDNNDVINYSYRMDVDGNSLIIK